MKKLILILFMMCVYCSYGQLQHFFPDSNACFSVSWMKFWFHGDTIIEDLTYKRVYVQYDDSIADFNNARYFAAIREDTATGKIYFSRGNEQEYLLYDFSVNVGDTVSFYSLWGGGLRERKQVVKSIDSILIDDNYRKKINFKSWITTGGGESWIEGIGSINGLFFAGDFDMADGMNVTILLCVHVEERLIYQPEDADFYEKYNCYIQNYTNIDEHKKGTIEIYPTIVDDILYIETDKNNEEFEYKIINIQGQIISNGLCTSNVINVANLNKGFYLIVISDNKSTKYIKTQKFIKY